MPIPSKYLAKFNENCIYHVYNRTNNREPLFRTPENYLFFLRKYDDYLHIINTFCGCLLPNHFHLLIRVKAEWDIYNYIEAKEYRLQTLSEKQFLDKKLQTVELIERAFKRFFQSYSMAFNKQYKRDGNLFYRPFKRVAVEKNSQFTQTVVYIHANPLKHRLTKDFIQYKWSSWQSILSESPTRLLRKESWIGLVAKKNVSTFIMNCHSIMIPTTLLLKNKNPFAKERVANFLKSWQLSPVV